MARALANPTVYGWHPDAQSAHATAIAGTASHLSRTPPLSSRACGLMGIFLNLTREIQIFLVEEICMFSDQYLNAWGDIFTKHNLYRRLGVRFEEFIQAPRHYLQGYRARSAQEARR